MNGEGDGRKPVRKSLARLLYSEDPRHQYAALRRLEGEPDFGPGQEDRVLEISRRTEHLTIAELARRLLEEKRRRRQGAISEQTREEVAALWMAHEERQRQRRQSAREPVVIQFHGLTLFFWIASAAVAGGILGSVATFWLAPKAEEQPIETAGVLIQPRSGRLLSADAHPDPGANHSDFEPAYYCWRCRQWLPVRRPQQPGGGMEGPRQALSERPLAAEPQKNRKGR